MIAYKHLFLLSNNVYMSRWCSGLERLQQWPCYLQGPGFESHLRPVEFFSGNKVSPLKKSKYNANICPMCPNKLAQNSQGHL